MNDETKIQQNIRESVLNRIHSGEINMRSRTYFLIRLALLCMTAILITFISIFLLSFVIFSSSLDGSLFLIRFGGEGLYHFFLTLPWFLLFIDVFLLIILDSLLKSFRLGYKNPVAYLFLGTVLIVTISSVLIDLTSFHQNVMSKIENNGVSLLPNIYSGVGSQIQKPGTWKGVVQKINENKFTFSYIKGVTGEYGVALVIAKTNVDVEKYLDVGDLVFVAGTLNNGEIMAYGIKKLSQ